MKIFTDLFCVFTMYTAQTGLPYFDRAAVTVIGSWYYGTAFHPMRGNQFSLPW